MSELTQNENTNVMDNYKKSDNIVSYILLPMQRN